MKILHTADWHIGNFPGPEVSGENARYRDICHCLDVLVEKAQVEKPELVIIAGDIFHQAKVWSDRGLRENGTAVHYIRELKKLAPVVILRGTPNHDSEQQFELLKSTFGDDGLVKIITEPETVMVQTSTGECVNVAGLPGFDRGVFRAKHPGLSKEEENEVFAEELHKIVLGLSTLCKPDYPSVFVSHYTIPGANMESGQTAFFSKFEPVIYPNTLQAAGFDLNCFGHIHRPQKVDNCGETYYSGAVSALNFNDEGQERGFYIHDISAEKSEFYALPTREFCTLRYEDADIVRFLDDTDNFAVTGVEDKIVRVIYNCTDEHNKALNKALLEKLIYKAGAFWVQEITPEKITVSVNREALAEENGPEEHLRRYFEDKGYKPEKIGEIIEAALPILAEATEKSAEGAHTGIFTPVSIEVKNYRNYRDESFSYDGISFCTINGENGAGKSSLFMDAMLDALYEEPREGDLTGWICNDDSARSGSIKFTFSIGDALYRVTRTRQKSGKATLNISEKVDGEWVDRSAEKFRDTQAIITNIVGMDSLTFKACALIMQDQYGLFLQADKEARMNILGSILGLGIYESLEKIAADKLTEVNREIRNTNDKASYIEQSLPDEAETEATIAQLNTDIEKRTDELVLAQKKIVSEKALLTTKQEAARRVAKTQSKLSALATKLEDVVGNKASHSMIINGAKATLSREAEIQAGVAEYSSLLEQEKELISARDRFNDLSRRAERLATKKAELITSVNAKGRLRDKLEQELAEISAGLTEEGALKAKHADYIAVKENILVLTEEYEKYAEQTRKKVDAQNNLRYLIAQRDGGRSTREAEIRMLEKKVALLDDCDCPIIEQATCKFLADAKAAQKLLTESRAELEQYNDETQILLNDAELHVRDAEKVLSNTRYSQVKMDDLKARETALAPYEEKYQSLGELKTRKSFTEQKLAEVTERITELSEELETVTRELADIQKQLDSVEEASQQYISLKSRIDEASKWLLLDKELPVAKERLTAASKRLEELDAEETQLRAERKDLEEELEIDKKASEGSFVQAQLVEQLEADFKRVRDELDGLKLELGGLQAQMKKIEDGRGQIAVLQLEAEKLGKTAAIYDDLKKAFSQDGIPHNVIRSIIPIFEATATSILGQMSGGKMSVEFITEKLLKSNNKKEVTTLDIIINDGNTGRLPYMSRSGGERVKAALSVILALSEIKSSKAGVQLGFLFIDEPPFLDAQGVQAYCDALEAIQSRYSDLKIMAITHDPTMKSRFPQAVDVVKTDEGSKVIYQ